MIHPYFMALRIVLPPRKESDLGTLCSSSAFSRDPVLPVSCTVTSSILCLVASMQDLVTCGSRDRRSQPLDCGVVTTSLQFGKV